MSDHDHDHGSGSGDGDMDMGGHDMSGMEMPMYFHTGVSQHILFKPWLTSNTGEFVGACIGIFLLAVIYEALKYYRETLYESNSAPLLDQSSRGLLGGIKQNILRSQHLVQTLLHMIQLVLSYFLMLIFMTYNVYLAVAITLGAGVGYLLFGWNKRSAHDITEHCH